MNKDFFKRKNEESEESYLWRIGQAKDNGEIEIDWNDVAQIMNKEFRSSKDKYKGASAYRKSYQYAKKFFESGVFNQSSETDYINNLKEAKRELERMKVQYRDERNEWQKQNRIDGRVEQKLDKLEKDLLSLGKINFKITENKIIESDNDVLVILSDLHIGQCFSSIFNNYNSTIAKNRLSQLLHSIKKIQATHNSKKCYVSLQGDLISGNIHKTIQVTNRENVIEQIKLATELISNFCYELSQIFEVVFLSSVCGNHSRIDRKDEALHDERLDDIVAWGVDLTLNHIDNFHLLNRKIDNGISDINIRGKTYIAVHGDYDRYDNGGLSKLCMFLGFIPYAVLYAHLHTNAYNDLYDVLMIRGGSLSGCGDDHTIEKRLAGKASQMVCVCDSDGVRALYPIKLR